MRLPFTIAIAAVSLLKAQLPSAEIKTAEPQLHEETATSHPVMASPTLPLAGLPVVGYVLGPGLTGLRTILVQSKTPRLGDVVPAPDNAQRLFLPPRQQYALVEQNYDAPMEVWPLHRAATSGIKQEAKPLTGSIAHPDFVVFSARGDAALLYSATSNRLQVVSNLPNQPSVGKDLGGINAGTHSLFAVTDDASLVVVWSADRASLDISSNGSGWNTLSMGFTPSAMAFVPHTHNLAMSDTVRNMILLMSDLESASGDYRVLAEGTTADHLAFTKNGDWLLAADFIHKQMSAIEVKTGTITPTPGVTQIDMLTVLRNGSTFLLSANPGLSLLQVDPLFDSSEAMLTGSAAEPASRRLAAIDVVSKSK